MKMVPILLAALMVACSGCGAGTKAMKIRAEKLSEKAESESQLLNGESGTIYDYTLDGKIKSMCVRLQTLQDGRWQEADVWEAEVSQPKGQLALTNLQGSGKLRIAWESEDVRCEWFSDAGIYGDTADMGWMENWTEKAEIVPGQPALLMLQCFSKGPLRVSSIEDYQNMEKLADEYDAVNAVTIVFSEKEIE